MGKGNIPLCPLHKKNLEVPSSRDAKGCVTQTALSALKGLGDNRSFKMAATSMQLSHMKSFWNSFYHQFLDEVHLLDSMSPFISYHKRSFLRTSGQDIEFSISHFRMSFHAVTLCWAFGTSPVPLPTTLPTPLLRHQVFPQFLPFQSLSRRRG